MQGTDLLAGMVDSAAHSMSIYFEIAVLKKYIWYQNSVT